MRYAGEYQDSESGCYYLRARYYDPSTQQFLTRDPLVAATEQAYTYANGSPLNFIDPNGKTAIAIPIGIAVVACGPLCWAALGAVTGVVLYLVITKLIQDQAANNVCSEGRDESHDTERAARRSVFRRWRIPTSRPNNYERKKVYGQNDNLKGPNGEPSEEIHAKDVNDNDVVIPHHDNGHTFTDVNPPKIAGPHYHGPTSDPGHIYHPQ